MNDQQLMNAHTVFMLGIAGTGMRGLAYLLRQRGAEIIGSDTTAAGERIAGITVLTEKAALDTLEHADVLIYTDAASEEHPLRKHALENNIPQIAYQDALANVFGDRELIAVTGTHGKSSTTAFLAHIFIEAGEDPSVLLGASVSDWPGTNARWGNGRYAIVEADEYRGHFLSLHPAHAIITSVGYDHPDAFRTVDDVRDAYSAFLDQISPDGTVITPAAVQNEHAGIRWPEHTVTIDEPMENISIPVAPGAHMQMNATLAVELAERLGIARNTAIAALKRFPGVSRRLEELGSYRTLRIISDYGHHPDEIHASLTALRNREPNAQILALFEPHTDERLKVFNTEFADALAVADGVLIYPVFEPAGREAQEDTRTRIDALAKAIGNHGTSADTIPRREDLLSAIAEHVDAFDVAIAFTAGELDARLRAVIKS